MPSGASKRWWRDMGAQDQVAEFHRAFGCAVNGDDTDKVRELRANLVEEEAEETVQALRSGDSLLTIARELADLIYVAYGTAISLGIDLDAAITEVHRANMSKLGTDGKPVLRDDGKVLKGPNFIRPDMSSVLR